MGTITDDITLTDNLGLEELSARAGHYDGDVATGDTLHVAFEGAVVDCTGGCSGDALPDWLTQLAAHAASLLTNRYAHGAVQQSPERVAVVAEAVPATPVFVWPASFAP